MGRKKKIKENSQNTLTYTGSITVSLMKKDKILSTKHYHNEGKLDLFKFFSYALSGRYNLAEALRPKYIRLYTLGEYGSAIPLSITTDEPTSTTYIMYKEAPTTVVDNGIVSTSFSFMIPFTQIDVSKDTNLLVLYPTATGVSPLAQFVVVESEEEPTNLGRLFDSAPSQNDYNLFVKWNMTINN